MSAVTAEQLAALTGTYSDPHHPGCLRSITMEGTTAHISGSDETLPDVWEVTGEAGDDLVVDFSSKGGPTEMHATWTTEGVITWSDGNYWQRLVPTPSTMYTCYRAPPAPEPAAEPVPAPAAEPAATPATPAETPAPEPAATPATPGATPAAEPATTPATPATTPAPEPAAMPATPTETPAPEPAATPVTPEDPQTPIDASEKPVKPGKPHKGHRGRPGDGTGYGSSGSGEDGDPFTPTPDGAETLAGDGDAAPAVPGDGVSDNAGGTDATALAGAA